MKNRPPKWTAGGARRKPDVRYEMRMMIEVVITKITLPGGLRRLNRQPTCLVGRMAQREHGPAGTKVTNRE